MSHRSLLRFLLAGVFVFLGACAESREGLAIELVLPETGSSAGGTQVVVVGRGFRRGVELFFDGVAATDVEVIDSKLLRARTPAHELGTVDVQVRGRGSSRLETATGAFTFVADPTCRVAQARVVGAATDPEDPHLEFDFEGALVGGTVDLRYESRFGAAEARADVWVADARITVRPLDAYDTRKLVVVVRGTSEAGPCDPHAMVLDVTTPSVPSPDPAEVAFGARAIVVSGDHALTAVATARMLQVYPLGASIDGPSGAIQLQGTPIALKVRGDELVVSYGRAGLERFALDATAGLDATSLGRFGSPGTANAIALGEIAGLSVVAIADGTEGLRLVELVDGGGTLALATPVTRGSNAVIAVDLEGTLLAFADGARIGLVDVSVPRMPVVRGSLSGAYQTVDLAAGRLYAGRGAYGIDVIDVSDPTTPSVSGSTPLGHGACTADCIDVAREHVVAGDRMYVAAVRGELLEYDLTDPDSPTLLGSRPVRRHAFGVAVDGDRLLAADDRGLVVFDRASALDAAPSYAPPGHGFDAQGIAVMGSRLYVAGGAAGLAMFPIGLSGELGDAVETPTPGSDAPTLDLVAVDVAVSNAALVANGRAGTARFALGASPTFVDSLPVRDVQSRIVTSGALTAVTAGNFGVELIRHASGTTTSVGLVPFASFPPQPVAQGADSVALDGTTLYVGARGVVHAVDVATPSSPMLLGSYVLPSGESVAGLDVARARLVLVTNLFDGDADDRDAVGRVHVLDVSDPSAMTRVHVSPDLGRMVDVTVYDDRIYASTVDRGVVVLDFREGADDAIGPIGVIPAPGRVGSVVGDPTLERRLYVANRVLGAVSIDLRVRF